MLDANTHERKSYWLRLAWFPIPATLLLTAWYWYTGSNPKSGGIQAISILTVLFSIIISFFIAWLAARSYRLSGSWPVLCLGCGTLAFGSVSLLVIFLLRRLNIALTVYLAGMLLTGLCHLSGAIFTLRPSAGKAPRSTALPLRLSYAGVLALLALVTAVAWNGLLPPVFVQNGGPTKAWTMLLVVTAIVFFIASVFLSESYRRTKSDFFFLYALSLALMSAGLIGSLAINDARSGANWVGRTALYLGGIYLLGAVLAAVRESGGWDVALHAALRESRKRYDLLFNTAVEGVIIQEWFPSGDVGKLIAANPAICEMLGYRPAELLQLATLELAPPPRQPVHDANGGEEAPLSDPPLFHESVLVARDGRKIHAEISTRRFESEGKRLALSVIRDVTGRKQSEEALRAAHLDLERRVEERTAELRARSAELQAANKELEAFCYSVSHDLRAPLRSIMGFSRIVLDELDDKLSDSARRCQMRVQDNARQMEHLIDDLLAFSRLGRHPLSKQLIEPALLVKEALEELHEERAGRDIEISMGGLPPCEADRSLLRQVFVNLLSNAIKYTRKSAGAKIEIGADDEDGVTIYWVKDNGAGFSMEYADKLFGVFQRLHRSEDFEGTGVGLALTHRIVQRHGGKIWADARLDEGATFFFTLGAAPQYSAVP